MPVLSAAELDEVNRKFEELRMRHMLQSAKNGALAVKAFVPATGIGKFDAVYLPQNNQLNVCIKARFDFVEDVGPGPQQSEEAWTCMEQMKFISDAQLQVAAWSDRYLITCARPGWERFYVNVSVRMEIADPGQEHYSVRMRKVRPPPFNGGIDHGAVPAVFQVNNGAPCKDGSGPEKSLFNVKEGACPGELLDSLPDKSGDFIEFPADSTTISGAQSLRLERLADFVNSNRLPDTQPIQFFVFGVLGKNDSAGERGLSKGRSAEVAAALNSRIMGNDMAVVASGDEPWIKESFELIKNCVRNRATGNGGVLLVVRTPQSVVHEVQLNHGVMRHEVGHMLGLPDEYMDMRSIPTPSEVPLGAVLPSTNVPPSLPTDGHRQSLESMSWGREQRPSTAPMPSPLSLSLLLGMAGSADRQEALPATPATTVSSSNSMHSGEDILPAHYITFWSALSTITASYVNPDQWKIVSKDKVNGIGTGKNKGDSSLRHFG